MKFSIEVEHLRMLFARPKSALEFCRSAMEFYMYTMKALGSYNVLATPGLASAMEPCMYNEGFGLIQCHGTLHV